jgi:hypothetical protein
MLRHCPVVDTDRVKSDSIFDGIVTTMTMLESGEVGNDVDLNLNNDDVHIFNTSDGI